MRYLFILVSLCLFVGCSNDTEPNVKQDVANEQVENLAPISFGEINVITKDKIVYVTGDAKTDADVFYYTLELGETVIIEETEVALNKETTEWRSFELEMALEDEHFTSEEAPLITFYGKSEGRIVNPNYVPVDLVTY